MNEITAGQFALVYCAMIAGATAVLPGAFSAKQFWADVRGHQATATFLLGAMANFLYGEEPAADDGDNPLERVLMVPLIAEHYPSMEKQLLSRERG